MIDDGQCAGSNKTNDSHQDLLRTVMHWHQLGAGPKRLEMCDSYVRFSSYSIISALHSLTESVFPLFLFFKTPSYTP